MEAKQKCVYIVAEYNNITLVQVHHNDQLNNKIRHLKSKQEIIQNIYAQQKIFQTSVKIISCYFVQRNASNHGIKLCYLCRHEVE